MCADPYKCKRYKPRSRRVWLPVQNNCVSQSLLKESHSGISERRGELIRLGIVDDSKIIRSKTVIIIGIGNLGSVTAGMLVRFGFGKVILFDYDKVTVSDLSGLFYSPRDVGLSKAQAAKSTLDSLNLNVETIAHDINITQSSGYEILLNEMRNGGIIKGTEESSSVNKFVLEDNKKCSYTVDLLLCCVGNNTLARMTINTACLSCGLVWVDCQLTNSVLGGYVRLLRPGVDPCLECYIGCEPTKNHKLTDDHNLILVWPSTISILSGMLVQLTLKFFSSIGKLSKYTFYDGLKNEISDIDLIDPHVINPNCMNAYCRITQSGERIEENRDRHIIHNDTEIVDISNLVKILNSL